MISYIPRGLYSRVMFAWQSLKAPSQGFEFSIFLLIEDMVYFKSINIWLEHNSLIEILIENNSKPLCMFSMVKHDIESLAWIGKKYYKNRPMPSVWSKGSQTQVWTRITIRPSCLRIKRSNGLTLDVI